MPAARKKRRQVYRREFQIIRGERWWTCSCCFGLFPESRFHKVRNTRGETVPHSHCKQCRSAYSKREDVKARQRDRKRAAYANPARRAHMLEIQRAHYWRHREKYLQTFQQRYQRHKFARVVGWRKGGKS